MLSSLLFLLPLCLFLQSHGHLLTVEFGCIATFLGSWFCNIIDRASTMTKAKWEVGDITNRPSNILSPCLLLELVASPQCVSFYFYKDQIILLSKIWQVLVRSNLVKYLFAFPWLPVPPNKLSSFFWLLREKQTCRLILLSGKYFLIIELNLMSVSSIYFFVPHCAFGNKVTCELSHRD